MKWQVSTSVLLASLILSIPILSDTPLVINYQGRLTDATGEPIVSDLDVLYALYPGPDTDEALWSETIPTTFANGLFTVKLGNNPLNPLDVSFFSDDTPYLAVVIDGEEVVRERLVASPYAIRSESAAEAGYASDAATLQGYVPSEFAQLLHPHTATDLEPQGDGSGLDADLLDGIDASELATVDHVHEPIKAQAGFHFITMKPGETTAVAFGSIRADGSIASSSGNITCGWNGTLERYEIVISGELYHTDNYATTVTVLFDVGDAVFVPMTNSWYGQQKLIVEIYQL
ncbi:MAG: hypothetical protein V3T31_00955 [candidate division Zixibacteria bacterium]